jgi:hypothetical protein
VVGVYPEISAVYICPGCDFPVQPGEDYVIAREYRLEPDVGLHLKPDHPLESIERRFHVGHFRGRMGDFFYELVPKENGQPSQ